MIKTNACTHWQGIMFVGDANGNFNKKLIQSVLKKIPLVPYFKDRVMILQRSNNAGDQPCQLPKLTHE